MPFDNSPNPYASPDRYQQGVSAERPPFEVAKQKVRRPGVALLVVGVFGLLGMGAYLVLTAFAMSVPGNPAAAGPPANAAEAERIGYYVGFYGAIGGMCLQAAAQIIVIFGGINLIQMKGRGIAMTACIVSLIPGASACFLLGIPFGIWGLVVLNDAEVRQVF
ncbi:MAG: hypothetical protein VB835_16065 [Pirellulales bacterium]